MRAAPLAKAHLAQYLVQSSDVLAEMRVNVLEEGTKNVVWYKERDLTEDEIVESVMESATNTLRWTIHRPKRGWYLRLRSPSFPPGIFIPLVPPAPRPQLPPPKPSSPSASSTTVPAITLASSEPDGSLTFSVRTSLPVPEKAPPGEVRIDVTVHSYPPTPPAPGSPSSSKTLEVPSPQLLGAKLRALGPESRSSVARFILTPSLPTTEPTAGPSAQSSFFARALSYLTPTLPVRATASFTLTPLDTPTPLLTFTDRTSTFSVSTTGLLEVNKGLERQMGVDPAFWIAVALAYLEFLADRDSYIAAASG